MGYWEMGEEGESFVAGPEPTNQMIWGDQPADIVGEALRKIKLAFVRDLGRMPSQREIIAGLKFTTGVMRDLAVEPRDAPEATTEQIEVARRYGYAAYGEDGEAPLEQRQAWTKVRDMLKELDKAEPVCTCLAPDIEHCEKCEPQAAVEARRPDTFDITEGTHVGESLRWLEEHGYIDALTASIPEEEVAPMLMFRRADMPFAPIQMARTGERLVYLPGCGVQVEAND